MKQLPLYTAIASISLLSACSGGSSQGAAELNQAPVVKVVDDITGTVGRSLVLDASSSYDPEGAQIDVSWALTRTPSNANPSLDMDHDSIVITPDLAGIYKVDVIVSDGELSTTKSISVFALNDAQDETQNEAQDDSAPDNGGPNDNTGSNDSSDSSGGDNSGASTGGETDNGESPDGSTNNNDSEAGNSGSSTETSEPDTDAPDLGDQDSSGETTGTSNETTEPNTDAPDLGDKDSSGETTGTCTIANYQAGTPYIQGDIVLNNNSYFYCDVAGWCSSNAESFYAPGTGSAWQSAFHSVTLNEACAVMQEDKEETMPSEDGSEPTDTDMDGSTVDNSGPHGSQDDSSAQDNSDTSNESGSDANDNSSQENDGSQEANQESSNHESWMDSVDTSGWPKTLQDTNTAFNNSTGKVVGTYFVEWGVYGRNFHVADIPAQNLTHILYGFIPVCGPNDSLQAANATGHAALVSQCTDKQDYEVTIHDKYAALEKTYPGDNWDDEIKGNFGQLMRLKAAQPEIKILPSIGGWTLSDPLFDLDSAQNRGVFVNSVIEFLTSYPFFDGVDIDWEFPGGGGANPALGSDTDGATYITLMSDLRSALNTLSESTGKQYEITSAIGTSPKFIAAVDYQAATQYMDYIFMMTYDYKGAWSSELGHQTNLHASNQTADDSLSVEISVNAMLDQGVDAGKLVVGVAKYGRGWKNITGSSDANPFNGQGGGAIDGTWENGILDYKDIEANYLGGKNGQGINGWQYGWDESAQAPYLWHGANQQLISFDDARSTIAKGNFVKQHNLGGVFSWEIDADTGTILNAMHEGLGHQQQ